MVDKKEVDVLYWFLWFFYWNYFFDFFLWCLIFFIIYYWLLTISNWLFIFWKGTSSIFIYLFISSPSLKQLKNN